MRAGGTKQTSTCNKGWRSQETSKQRGVRKHQNKAIPWAMEAELMTYKNMPLNTKT